MFGQCVVCSPYYWLVGVEGMYVQGIEQILKKDSDIAIVLNMHLAQRKGLLKGHSKACRTFTTSLSYQDGLLNMLRLIIGYE